MSAETSEYQIRPLLELPKVEVLRGTVRTALWMRHLHEDYHFGIAETGCWTTRYRGSDLVVAPGYIQLAQPGEVSTCAFNDGPGATFRTLSVPVDHVARISEELHGSRKGVPWFRDHIVADRRTSAVLADIHERLLISRSSLEISALVDELVCGLLERFAENWSPPRVVGLTPGALRRVLERIEDDLESNPSTEELASLAGVSPFHFNRTFRRCVGLPPHAWQNHRRVLKATVLLRRGFSSSTVATLLGFSDQSHFIRCFRRQIGMTPERYRRSLI